MDNIRLMIRIDDQFRATGIIEGELGGRKVPINVPLFDGPKGVEVGFARGDFAKIMALYRDQVGEHEWASALLRSNHELVLLRAIRSSPHRPATPGVT